MMIRYLGTTGGRRGLFLGRAKIQQQVAALPYYSLQNNVAWKSTTSAADLTESSSSASASTNVSSTSPPKLTTIPTLPYLGSFITSYSGTPELSPSKTLDFWPEMRRRFGNFYRMGMPGAGAGSHGHLHVIQDPKEMTKLLRKEGEFPSGTTEFIWAPKVFSEKHYNPSIALIGRGPEWKRFRFFAQKDLLAPKSAARYLPAVLEAARQSSQGAPLHSDNLNYYLNLASFELFVNVTLGHLPKITVPDQSETNQEDIEFCTSVANALRTNQKLSYSNYHRTMVTKLGIETDLYKEFYDNWLRVYEIARKMVLELKALRDSGAPMTLTQENSYINQAFERQKTQDDITEDEVVSLASGLLPAGVDTTSNMLTWKILHIATHPEVQDKMYEELTQWLDENGHLTEEAIAPANSPYLHAMMRESHRCANPASVVPLKRFDTEIEVHGVTLPPGSVIGLDGYSTGMDPDLVEDPMEFRPERFLPAAVAARKGTPAEIIDHAFFSGPFSQGARRCPGSRVANLEAHTFIAQLILDWKLSIPSLNHWTECPYDTDTLLAAQLPPIEFTARQ